MNELKEYLGSRFGAHRVSDFTMDGVELPLLKIELELSASPVTVIMTNGLRNYSMPVPVKLHGQEHAELFFCLPSYWDLDALNTENMRWPFTWLDKLGKHLLDKETWYGPGHTFANGNPPESFSSTMKPNHLILTEPIKLEEHLSPAKIDQLNVYFLAVVPIYEQEFDIKMTKGFVKFLRKFRARNGSEIVDDFRENIFKSRFRIF
jgi:hypothetical protein